MTLRYVGALLTGVIIGFLGGLFGKGGSAVATPLLSLAGFPGFVAVASPLLPNRENIVLPGAGHQMWYQDPHVCRRDVEEFLARNGVLAK